MVGFLTFITGLLLGLLVACSLSGYMLIEYYRADLNRATEAIETNNELLEAIEDHAIEIKVES